MLELLQAMTSVLASVIARFGARAVAAGAVAGVATLHTTATVAIELKKQIVSQFAKQSKKTVLDLAVQHKEIIGGSLLVASFGGLITYYIKHQSLVKIVKDGTATVYQLKDRTFKEKVREGLDKVVKESVRENSIETSSARPRCQILVGRKEGDFFDVFGSAIRIHNSMVVPTHVLQDAASEGYVYFKGSTNVIRILLDEFEILDTDVSYRNLSDTQWSVLGAPTVKLFEKFNTTEIVSIVGVCGKGTVGKLIPDNTIFGRVTYLGTTKSGYSGAPYMKGTQVVGMHCWGGRENAGYSASYLKVKLDIVNKERPESTEDFLLKVFKNKRFDHRDVKNYGSEVIVKYEGQYHQIDYEEWQKVEDQFQEIVNYDDSESTLVAESLRHSGECQSLKLPGVSGNLIQDVQAQLDQITMSMNELKELTRKPAQIIRKSNKQSTHSAGQTSADKVN